MDIGAVRIADDRDFDALKSLVDKEDDWKLEYDKTDDTRVSDCFYFEFYLEDVRFRLLHAVVYRCAFDKQHAAVRGGLRARGTWKWLRWRYTEGWRGR